MLDDIGLPLFDGALVKGPVFFHIEIEGDPGFKGRHRSRIVTPKNKKPFIHNYPDPVTEAYEKMIAQHAHLIVRRKPPSERPLHVIVEAVRSVPESWSMKAREAALRGRIMPTSRPDGDNYYKIIDALKGIVWQDDSQIVAGGFIKRYGLRPMLIITAREFIPP